MPTRFGTMTTPEPREATTVRRPLQRRLLSAVAVGALLALAAPAAPAQDLDGTLDMECGSTTMSLSRQAEVDFSIMTFVDGGSLLVTDASAIRGISTLGGKRVAVIPGTTTEKSLNEALKKNAVNATVVAVKDHDAGVAALDGGTADAYASDRVILIGIGRTSKSPDKLSLVQEFFSYEPYGLMLRRNDSAFRLSVNRALASLYKSGDVLPIYEKWFGSMTTAGQMIGAMYLMNALPE